MGVTETLRCELRAQLAAQTAALEAALRDALARPLLPTDAAPQFELCPYFFGITLRDSDDTILPDDWLEMPTDWFERAEAADVNTDALISDELFPWLASAWEQAGGAERHPGAVASWHGFAPRYALDSRTWTPPRR